MSEVQNGQSNTAIGDDVRLITADEVASILCVSTRTVWRLLSTGKMVQPIRLGGSVRWRLDEVREWINNGCPVVTR